MNSENKIQLNYLSKLIEFNNNLKNNELSRIYLEEYYRVLKESLNKEINILRCKQCNFIFDSGDQYKIISSKKNNQNNLDLKIQCLKCNKKFTNSLNNLQ
jgi:RNase P subunit RPR2